MPAQLRSSLRAVGLTLAELMVAAGFVLGLYVVYQSWYSGVLAHREQDQASEQLDRLWASENGGAPVRPEGEGPDPTAPRGTTSPEGPNTVTPSTGNLPSPSAPDAPSVSGEGVQPNGDAGSNGPPTGQPIARIYIPRFGDWKWVVNEGASQDILDLGPGHYSGTAMPGQVGNFAVAGHRVTHGAPFNATDELQSCDAIVVETRTQWFTYRVLPMSGETKNWNTPDCLGVKIPSPTYAAVFGHTIVPPTAGYEVAPIPLKKIKSSDRPTAALLTFTTCNPKYSDRERLITHAVLTATYSKAATPIPPELGGTQ